MSVCRRDINRQFDRLKGAFPNEAVFMKIDFAYFPSGLTKVWTSVTANRWHINTEQQRLGEAIDEIIAHAPSTVQQYIDRKEAKQ